VPLFLSVNEPSETSKNKLAAVDSDNYFYQSRVDMASIEHPVETMIEMRLKQWNWFAKIG
jgi:hypothetical protein